MGKKRNIIEINGKRYDTHSGAPVSHGDGQPVPVVVKPITVHHHHDTHHVDTPASATPAKPSGAVRKAAKKSPRRAPQRSATLMRRSVKRPATNLRRHAKAQGHVDSPIDEPSVALAPKLSFGNPDPKRLQRANHVKKSQLIMHFNQGQPAYAVSVTVVQTSQPAPATAPSKPALVLKAPKRQPAPEASDIFERAVQQATSHLEPAPQKPRKHRLHLGRKQAKHARA